MLVSLRHAMNRRRLGFALALAALIAAGAWLWPRTYAAPPVTFHTLDGSKLALSQLQGKVVLVNFWATTCGVCLREMPELTRTFRDYRERGFELIAVSMSYDPPWQVADYTLSKALPFTVAMDVRGDVSNAFGGIEYTPTGFLINRGGKVTERIIGLPDFAKLRRAIERELGKTL